MKRKRLWVALVLVLVPGVGMVLATRTDVLKGAVLSGVSDALGGEVTASSVRLTWDGRVVITDLQIDAPGVQEVAGRVLSATQLVARVDWSSTATGNPRVTDLKIIKPLLRVSVDSDSGALNLGALGGSSDGDGALEIPSFSIVDGTIELGEHNSVSYTPLNGSTLRVDGNGGQVEGSPNIFEFSFVELDREGQQAKDPTRVIGSIDLESGTVESTLSALDLADWSSRSLPSAYQPLWESMGVRGRVPGASFTYDAQDGLTFGVEVDGVAMKLPFDLREEVGQQLVELNSVTGTLTFSGAGFEANIAGMVEDIPLKIDLDAAGFSPETAATAHVEIENFELSEQPKLLPIAPRMVNKMLNRFGSPSGIVTLVADIERGEPVGPGTPGAWTYSGYADLKDGRGAFNEFAYPITDIDARFTFEPSGFRVERLVGKLKGGGTVRTREVLVAPIGNDAEVIAKIEARGVPLTEVFREALPENRRGIYDALFDLKEHERLLEAGLFRASSDEPGDAPVFELGGFADFDIDVYRPLGKGVSYQTNISVRIPEAGMVPIGFPYPVYGTDIALDIKPRSADVRRTALQGLTGMTGAIEGEILFPKGEKARPDLLIEAWDMPIDRALALALPEGGMGEAGSPRDALLELGLSGSVNGSAHVRRIGDERIGFEVNAALDNVSSSPDETLRLDGVTGNLRITRDEFEVSDLRGTIGGSPFAGSVGVVFARPLYGVESSITGGFDATNIELSAPFEDLASRFDGTSGAALERLRSGLAPKGRVNAVLGFSMVGDGALDYTLRLEPRSDLSLLFDGQRWDAHQPRGVLTVTPGLARFETFSAALGIAGGERFSTLLNGTLPTTTSGGSGSLDVNADAVRLDSVTARSLLGTRFGGAAETLATLGVSDALFDLEASLRMEGEKTDAQWTVTPAAVDTLFRGIRTETTATGSVRGENDRVVVDNLTLNAETWTLNIDGSRTRDGIGLFTLNLATDTINDSLLSLLPEAVDVSVRGIDLGLTGTMAFEDATVTLSPDTDPRVAGVLRYDGLSARIGAPITGAVGTGWVDASAETFTLDLALDEYALAGIRVTEGAVRAVRPNPGEDLLIPTLSGKVHDGVLIGRGVVRTSQAPITFELSAELASVGFAGVLDDLGIAGEETAADRGLMDAGLLLHGRLDRASERRGRATVRVQGGRVLDLPGVIRLLELSNLQAPGNEEVDLGYADIFFAGNKALVDRITLFSDSLRIVGTGEVDLPTQEIDLSFSTYGANYVPILSLLIEGIREEIASARVTGTLAKPVFKTEQLRSTRALLDAIAGPEPGTPANPRNDETPSEPDRPSEQTSGGR